MNEVEEIPILRIIDGCHVEKSEDMKLILEFSTSERTWRTRTRSVSAALQSWHSTPKKNFISDFFLHPLISTSTPIQDFIDSCAGYQFLCDNKQHNGTIHSMYMNTIEQRFAVGLLSEKRVTA